MTLILILLAAGGGGFYLWLRDKGQHERMDTRGNRGGTVLAGPGARTSQQHVGHAHDNASSPTQ